VRLPARECEIAKLVDQEGELVKEEEDEFEEAEEE